MSALNYKLHPEVYPRTEATKDTLQVLIEFFNEQCKGVKNATKAKYICFQMRHLHNIDICPQFLRDLIFQIRNESLVPGLCGTPQIGYFVAESHEEMDDTIRSLQSRLSKQIRTYRALRAQQYRMKLKSQIEFQNDATIEAQIQARIDCRTSGKKETLNLAGSRAPKDI